jgi:hypothetical protein
MSKELKLKNEINALKTRNQELKELLAKQELDINEKESELVSRYKNFFNMKKSKGFVLYERYPGKYTIELYNHKISHMHPMQSHGNFNIKELAIIIKLMYQFEKQDEYSILTIGKNHQKANRVNDRLEFEIIPELFFIIGNNNSLSPYKEFNGLYLGEEEIFEFERSFFPKKDLIAISADSCSFKNASLDIKCLTGNITDIKDRINYYDYIYRNYNSCIFDIHKNIYAYLNQDVNNYNSVKDILNFKMHLHDSFISKILISISIYKKNNNKAELSNDDYSHIFDVLYGEKVDIHEQVEKNISKELKYVPNKHFNK